MYSTEPCLSVWQALLVFLRPVRPTYPARQFGLTVPRTPRWVCRRTIVMGPPGGCSSQQYFSNSSFRFHVHRFVSE
ncbi:hypothetical protein BJV77DRAFT_799829 [Russula vinacea]|nr:hypothetical protein BJV77DRAFT_799829 [Russula vinacea]